MFKIWKQAWQVEGSSHEGSGHERTLSTQSSGTSGGKPFMASTTAVPIAELALTRPVASSLLYESPILAQNQTPDEIDVAPDEPPAKRRRIDDSSSFLADSVAGSLPEIVALNTRSRYTLHASVNSNPNSLNNIEDRVFERAAQENVIVELTGQSLKSKVYSHLLKSFTEAERNRAFMGIIRRRRISLLVTLGTENKELISSLAENHLHIGVYSGSSHESLVNQWSQMSSMDVIVVDTNILFESLTRGLLAMSQIRLLVIDELLSSSETEFTSLLQVMNTFYSPTDFQSRPRIFGAVTCLSLNSHSNRWVMEFERIVDIKFLRGLEDGSEGPFKPIERPKELVVIYDVDDTLVETTLFKSLLQLDPQMTTLGNRFIAAQLALRELGSCGSDLVWRHSLPEQETMDTINGGVVEPPIKPEIKNMVKHWTFAMPNVDSTSQGFNVSSKFANLVQVLKTYETDEDAFRGVVFVQSCMIALVIVDLLRALGDPVCFLRPQALLALRDHVYLQREQDIISAFGTGTCNLLICVQSCADLDIPPASVVVQFDPTDDMIAYAYTRVRTRTPDGHIIHMVERGNDTHRQELADIAQLDETVQSWIDRVSHSPASAIPPGTLYTIFNSHTGSYGVEVHNLSTTPFILDPTTGARIYHEDATAVLYRLISARASEVVSCNFEPLFAYEAVQEPEGESYKCSVLLPGGMCAPKLFGSPHPSLARARRDACYRTCIELFKNGFLDHRLFPRRSSVSRNVGYPFQPGEGNIHTDVRSSLSSLQAEYPQNLTNGTRPYPRKAPNFWSDTLSDPFECLYPTVVIVDHSDTTSPLYSPILLFTRLPLPGLTRFSVFFSGVSAHVHLKRAAPLTLDAERLQYLYLYTIRLCRAITNKPLDCSFKDMAYFVAPLGPMWNHPRAAIEDAWLLPTIAQHIPWDLVQKAAADWAVPLRSNTAEQLAEDTADAAIQDRWVEFTRRYDVVRIRYDLNPLSRPADSPREHGYANLVEYCKARRKGFEGLKDYKQPLLEVARVPAVLNRLTPTSKPFNESIKATAKYLIPELCAKFTIPASTFRTALLLPSIIRRIDDLLLVKESNAKFFNNSVAEEHLHAALSTPAAAVEFDYERLELLGDAFLKYLSSIYLFVTNPSQHEGHLHIARQQIISNKALLLSVHRLDLPQYIQSKPLNAKLWQPPNFHLDQAQPVKPVDVIFEDDEGIQAQTSPQPSGPGRTNLTNTSVQSGGYGRRQDDQSVQWLGDKAVADVVEAIVGAAYITGGRDVALRVAKALNIPLPYVNRWSDFSRRARTFTREGETAKVRDTSILAIEKLIGHKFHRPQLLAQALTHPSVQRQKLDMISYERLEFLGDAVLDFLVIRYIFHRDGQMAPGALTLLKGSMVANSTLAAICVSSGLYDHLIYESNNLAENIKAYAASLAVLRTTEYERATQESRSPGQYWLEVEPPKALSDVIESILAAIYISDDFCPVGSEMFFDRILKPFYDQHITLRTLCPHPTKSLFELFQAHGCQKFQIVKEPGSDEGTQVICCTVIVHDIVLASATGSTSSHAAKQASFAALDALEGHSTFMACICDCRALLQSKKAKEKAIKRAMKGIDNADDAGFEEVLDALLSFG